jgi:hypothetical protein
VTAGLVHLFCSWLAAGSLFIGGPFVANAAFNNLGYPVLSTMFPVGVLVGQASGSVVLGMLALTTAFHAVGRLGTGPQARQRQGDTLRHRQRSPRVPRRAPLVPASTRAAISMASLRMV